MKIPLGKIAYTRSGDKGPNANVGVIFITNRLYQWGLKELTDKKIKKYFSNMVKGI